MTVARKGRFRRVRKLAILLQEPAWRRALRRGSAAAVEHREVAFSQDFRTIIDVGAHHGQFALMARQRFPAAQIICVEPLPPAVARLHKVFAGDSHVRIVAAAAANAQGEREMHVSRKTDSSSLLPIMQSYVDAFPGTEQTTTEAVRAAPLDELVEDFDGPALLKIDAQGGEREVWAGAQRVLGAVDAVYIECSFVEFYAGQPLADDVVSTMLGHGLRLRGVYSVVRDAEHRCLQADLLFERG